MAVPAVSHRPRLWRGSVATGRRGREKSIRVVSESVNSGQTVTFTYDDDSLFTVAGALQLTRGAQHGAVTGTTIGVVSDSVAAHAI